MKVTAVSFHGYDASRLDDMYTLDIGLLYKAERVLYFHPFKKDVDIEVILNQTLVNNETIVNPRGWNSYFILTLIDGLTDNTLVIHTDGDTYYLNVEFILQPEPKLEINKDELRLDNIDYDKGVVMTLDKTTSFEAVIDKMIESISGALFAYAINMSDDTFKIAVESKHEASDNKNVYYKLDNAGTFQVLANDNEVYVERLC